MRVPTSRYSRDGAIFKGISWESVECLEWRLFQINVLTFQDETGMRRWCRIKNGRPCAGRPLDVIIEEYGLAFGELEAFACAGLAVFFALDFTGVASQQASVFESGVHVFIGLR